ncbi:S8 family peptidase [Methylocystis echinoides]|nr:S8 family peptidase [Methylocystis echinoides]
MDEGRLPMTVRATTDWGVSDAIPGPRRNEVLSAVGYAMKARVNVALDPSTIENFETAAEKYVEYEPDSPRKPHHFNFFEAQPSIGLTTVADLWVSQHPLPELDTEIPWEVWLQPASEPRFRETLEIMGLKARRAIAFADVRVIGLSGTRRVFERLARGASIAQLRPASSLNSNIFQVPSGVQTAAVQAAARRITPAPQHSPAVCLLDTGVKADHPLLRTSIGYRGAVGGGGLDDWDGHGTQMAGIALFENLPEIVAERTPVQLTIGIESLSVQPPPGVVVGANLPAERVRQAVDSVEAAINRTRTFCFAMNAPDEPDDGGPSSLSSEVDELAFDVAGPRLFCVSAGNLTGTAAAGDYAALNETTGILSPAQAWNALTVAACTDLVSVPETHQPVASEGDLCPWSRTAVNWERRHKPPSKPDVVFEGGNQMIDIVSAAIGPHVDLCLLTTSSDSAAPLTLTGQTSAATAAVAGLCAKLQAEYPMLWPETIRGLVIHSCEHTEAMRARATAVARLRGSYQQAILERFGYGRPDRRRAMENAEDALTLITQCSLRPLRLNDDGNRAILGQMRYHTLP